MEEDLIYLVMMEIQLVVMVVAELVKFNQAIFVQEDLLPLEIVVLIEFLQI